MTCGLVNCGRQQFGGVGGNGHALRHFEETGHMVGAKLGTITPEGGGGEFSPPASCHIRYTDNLEENRCLLFRL